MNLVDMLLPEYDRELGTTRRLIERVPEVDFSWKPHPKSWTLHELVAHLSQIPYWGEVTLTTDSLDLALAEPPPSRDTPSTVAEILAAFDQRVLTTRMALASRSNAELMAPWTLRRGKEQLFTMPKVAVFRSLVMNHLIHHRGQLSVYLRERNVPIPPIYGPTADEA